jgi:hypothetical protein
MVAGSTPMNHGVEISRGEWIAPLDDDDEFTPDHVEVMLNAACLARGLDFAWGIAESEHQDGSWSRQGSWRCAAARSATRRCSTAAASPTSGTTSTPGASMIRGLEPVVAVPARRRGHGLRRPVRRPPLRRTARHRGPPAAVDGKPRAPEPAGSRGAP